MPDVGGILRDMHLPWPEADENALREAAAAWYRLADAFRDGCGRANSAAGSLTSNNEGAAIDAFEKYWNKYGDRGKGALPLGAEACDAMGKACTQYADGVALAKRKIEELLAEAGAALAVGTAGAFITFGVAEGVADGVAAAILADVTEVFLDLGIWAGNAVELISGPAAAAIDAGTIAVAGALSSDGAAEALGAGAVGAYNGVASAGLSSIADNQIRALFGDKPLSAAQVRDALIGGAEAGSAGGVLGKLSELGQPQLAALLRNVGTSVAASDIQLSLQMMELARQVEGTPGKIAASVLTKAATQLVTVQQINADKIVEGQIPSLLKRAAGKGEG